MVGPGRALAALLLVARQLAADQCAPPPNTTHPASFITLEERRLGGPKNLQCNCYYAISNFTTNYCNTSNCPFMSYYQKGGNDTSTGCSFRCVAATSCGNRVDDPDGRYIIADHGKPRTAGTCRQCQQPGCLKCAPGWWAQQHHNVSDWCESPNSCTVPKGTKNYASDGSCCASGYYWCDGACCSSTAWIFYALVAVMVLTMLLFLVWYIALVSRPIINEKVLARAWLGRTRRLLRDSSNEKKLYKIFTNLRALPPPSHDGTPVSPVGGAATLLFFNYQGWAFIWCLLVTLLWLVVSKSLPHGEKLLEDAGMPSTSIVEVCRAELGYEAQQQIISQGYVYFTSILYAVSTIGAMVFAVRQYYLYSMANITSVNMTDFAIILNGFPEESGAIEDLEEKRAKWVQDVCKIEPVGVSICWDFWNEKEELAKIIEDETKHWLSHNRLSKMESRSLMLASQGPGAATQLEPDDEEDESAAEDEKVDPEAPGNAPATSSSQSGPASGCFSRLLEEADRMVLKAFGATMFKTAAELSTASKMEKSEEEILAFLKKLRTTGYMYVVFKSREEKEQAYQAFLQSSKASSSKYEGKAIFAKRKGKSLAPETVVWQHWGLSGPTRFMRTCCGVFTVLALILLWATCFYLPYGNYVFKMYAAGGVGPAEYIELAMSGAVVMGILIIFGLTDMAVRKMGFKYTAHEQSAYLCLYICAMLINLSFDMTVLVYTSADAFKAMGTRTIRGKPIDTLMVGTFNPLRLIHDVPQILYSLSQRLAGYSLKGCFLAPPFAEMICLYAFPNHVKKCLIRSRHVSMDDARRMLEPNEFDIGRYGDITVYSTQLVLAFFLSPGFVLQTAAGLLVGVFILYTWDHYRALRQVRGFCFSGTRTDAVGQLFMVLPVSLIGACAVYHGTGSTAWFKYVSLTFCIHAACHSLFVLFAAPLLGKRLAKKWHRKSSADEPTFSLTSGSVSSTPPVGTSSSRGSIGDRIDYQRAAKLYPANWFNTNPVHCLRSRYIQRHSPPFIFFERGYEHLQLENASIGQFYEAKTWCKDAKSFDVASIAADAVKQVAKKGAEAMVEMTNVTKQAISSAASTAGQALTTAGSNLASVPGKALTGLSSLGK